MTDIPKLPSARLSDGQFALPVARHALAFTGERMTTEMTGQIAFEHFHRYCLARDLCVGRDVLDVAAGEGYGSAFIASTARRVIGVEIDAGSVRHAQASYVRDNLEFREGSALDLPLDDASVDIVVSFETLEHLPDQNRFLQEVRRVLRPGGLFVVSSPDRTVYSAPGQPANPYHVLELTGPEFSALLEAHFARHRLLSQRALIGSVISDPAGGWRSYDRRNASTIEAMPGLSRSPYLIALASDGALPELGSSAYIENPSIDHLLEAPPRAAALHAEAEMLKARLAQTIDAAGRELAHRTAELARSTAQLAEAEAAYAAAEARHAAEMDLAGRVRIQQVSELDATIQALYNSTWWRLGRPVRRLARALPALARLVRLARWTLTGQLSRRLREERERPEIAPPAAPEAPVPAAEPVPAESLRSQLGLPAAVTTPDAASLILPTSQAPLLSVIVPTYGQVPHTLRCLATLAAHPPSAPFEVLVVDDASGDEHVPELREVRGIRLTERPHNLGFLRSCNAAALDARGDYIFLLNNDTEVMPGALDALLGTFADHPEAGLVGARLLYPDGWLQEAGGIVWNDGSAWNYGNRDDPRKPEYGYLREADYVSGAAIMIPTALWRELGGFDELYLPAYCEDSDLAFRIRAAGRSVLYQPAATVIHDEGVSHGTDTSKGIKAYQVVNAWKMRQRWNHTYARDQLPAGRRVMRARDRALHRKVTLVIDYSVPQRDRDAGSRTMVAFIDALLASGRIVKFWPANGLALPGYTAELQQKGVEVLYGPWSGFFPDWISAHGAEIDEVLVSRPHVAAETMRLLRRHSTAPIVFYGHDLHHARARREAEATGNTALAAEADRLLAEERRAWRGADLSLYPSEEEAAAVRQLEPDVEVRAIVPYALPERDAPPPVPEGREGLLFVAGFGHPPNVDAALWLVRDILPLLRAEMPGLRLSLVGSSPTPEVLALAGADLEATGVEVTGFVSDEELQRRYDRARVAVSPLRFGAGLKLKVVEALHEGIPLVTTSVGAQGLPGLERVIDVADEAGAIAAALLRLLRDDELWRQRSTAQRAFVEGRFSAKVMQEELAGALSAAAGRNAARQGGMDMKVKA